MKWRARAAGGKRLKRFAGGEGVRVEQPPEVVVGRILAHVRRGGEQQQMIARAKAGRRSRSPAGRSRRQRFRQLVALRLVDAAPHRLCRQLVRFVEHHQVVGRGLGAAQRGRRRLPRASVSRRDDGQVASFSRGTGCRRGRPRRRRCGSPRRNSVRSSRSQFPTRPAGGTTSTRRMRPRESISRTVQAGHDGLAGAGVVRQQKAQRVLAQHVLVHRDALVGQRIDARDLAGEGGVELVAERQPVGFRDGQHGVRVAGEIKHRQVGCGRANARRWRAARLGGGELLLQLAQLRQRQRARRGLAGLPAQHRERSHMQLLGEPPLRPPQALAQVAHVEVVPKGVGGGHDAPRYGVGAPVSIRLSNDRSSAGQGEAVAPREPIRGLAWCYARRPHFNSR